MNTYEQVMKSLQTGQYAPVYLLCGEESYYIDQVSDWIEANVLDESSKAFDMTVVYGRDLQGADIAPAIGAARGFAMFGGAKVVIVKEAQTIKKWEALGLYLDNPQPSTLLVICYKHGTPDKRSAWWKKADKQGVVMVSERLRDYKVEEWIRNYLAERVKVESQKSKVESPITIDPVVPKLLADYIGSDLSGIVSAVDKLLLGRQQGQNKIDASLVERNIGISKDFNVFELQTALIKGDIVKANQITQYFADSKDHPMIKELGILYGFFANLMIYHYLPDKNDRVAAPALGVNPFFVKDYAAAAKRYPAGKTFKIIGYFREIDARLKGINNPSTKEDGLWKELIYKIMH